MIYVIFAIIVIIFFTIKNKVFAKIDEETEEFLRTPGRANVIRNNYSEVIDYILSFQNYQILFEREDMIKIGTSDSVEFFVISNYSGGLMVAFIKRSSVMKEWDFSAGESSAHIIYSIKTKIY